MKRIFVWLTKIVLHLAAVGLITYSFLPIAKWYLNYRPIWGIDFFLTSSLVNLLKGSFVPPFAFWNYAWFAGWPQIANYPILPVYLVGLFTNFFGILLSSQLFVIASTLIFLLGCYFLFYQISKSFPLALILAVATAFSSGVYQTLTWAGSLPSYSAQATFPWILFFLVWYFETGNIRFFLISTLIGGITIWIHQQVFIAYILPAVTLLIFLRFQKGWAVWEKIKTWLFFVVISLIIGLPQFYSAIGQATKVAVVTNYFTNATSTTSAPPSQTQIDIANFNKSQVARIITDNHPALFYLMGITAAFFVLSLIIRRKLSSVLEILPFLILSGYFSFYIWLFGQGISIYHGGWYRLFWSVPVWVGAVASIFWKESLGNFFHFLKNRLLKLSVLITLNLAVIIIGTTFIFTYSKEWTISKITLRSQASSAYPDILNVKITDQEREQLKTKLVPSWINGDETNFRLYDADQTVNLWWNSLYKMPLARGYLDPPSERGFLFWLDAALSETKEGREPQLVKSFGYPIETAISNALFLVDWNAIRFYEGGHEGDVFVPFPKYLEQELIKKDEVLDLNAEKYTKRPVTLKYYEIKNENTSPILSATNASTVGIFASDQGYEVVIRAMAERGNYNSQYLVPVKLGKFIDFYDLETLKKFDSLYLYDYDYKNFEKAFKRLTDYVAGGKKVFVETGVEVKQSQGVLSEFFPVEKVERKGLGRDWELENPNQIFGQGVNFKEFSPPVFDQSEWKMSYASDSEVRQGANVILKNHGKVVMASQKVGGGEVIWSGMNFAYHLTRNHNGEEAKLFENILSSIVDLNKKTLAKYNVIFKNANNRIIETEGAKGILFKEQAYDGWKAQFVTGGEGKRKNLQIFKAGPASPGFIYIPLSESGKAMIKLEFLGSFKDNFFVAISLFLVIIIFEEAVLKGLFLGRLRNKAWFELTKRISVWWEKEET